MVKFRSDNAARLLVVAGLALLVGLITASTAWAVETRSGDSVVIGPDEVVDDDLYVTANNVVIDGTIRGDLVAFGQNITVDGTVEGDLIAAGRSVEIDGLGTTGGRVDHVAVASHELRERRRVPASRVLAQQRRVVADARGGIHPRY